MRGHIAVVGAGPAGLSAAHRLRRAEFAVTVFERQAVAGGRTRTEHHGDGHWVDSGAGWLASFYPDTLALLDEIGQGDRLSPMQLRGGGELLLDGRLVPAPNSVRRILATRLLGAIEKARFFAAMTALFARQRGNLRVDVGRDGQRAVDALGLIGSAARDRIVRPNFEGPFFARLEDMSAALVRSWLRCLSVGTFFHVDQGMDAPWRHLGDILEVRFGACVEAVAPGTGGVDVHVDGAVERFDGVIVAVPAPVAASIVGAEFVPSWIGDVEYVPHVRLYAARRGGEWPRRGIHVFPNDLVATVEHGSGRYGAWGQVPDDWEWGLVCAPSTSSGPLVDADGDEVQRQLWQAAQKIDAELFDLETADVVQLIRWRHAVPLVGPGYFARIESFRQHPPLAFAGDWLGQPCVEGAVRSGIAAAACFTAIS